uniref:DUF1758 domain-containing protein n=1 Tax=Loa loa TaxID=7209 RepID=A0A1I7VP88_LOALO
MSSNIIASIQPAKTRSSKLPTTHGSSIFKPSLQRKKGKRRKRLTNASQRGKSKEQERSIPRPNLTVNLPQLSLPTFNGEPRQWRQFWSSFNAAVHSQTIPEIQKLNYLFSCLRGNALQVVSGYEIAPENYEVIRRLLKNKYGDPSTITTILYNELQAIKRNEKEWMTTIENIEDFLSDIVHVTQQVKNSQNPSTFMDTKLTIDKLGQKPRYNPRGTSALSMVRSNSKPLSFAVRNNQHSSQLTVSKRRPCIFCNRDHWDSECDVYPTANGRRNRLKLLKKCLICFKDSHNGERCKIKKQCFYCKALHNSALCDSRSTASSNSLVHSEVKDYHENLQIPPKMDYSASLYNSTNTTRTNTTKETLLLCKEVKVFNPTQPQRQKKALALFNISSQLSFISQKLSQQLKLTESDKQIMKITPFGMRNPTLCPTASTQMNVQRMENDVIRLHVNVVEHLTNELKVVDTPREIQFQELTNHWKKPDILIGADHFFKFIKLQNVQELSSGQYVGAVKGWPHDCRKWRCKLESIGIQESPNDNDDEETLKHFQRTLTKLDGRYHVCWPWRDCKQNLSDNYGLCMGRLKNILKKLQLKSLLQVYHNTIIEQLQAGMIEEVPHNDEVGVIHYLPHHEVWDPNKNTTKLRIVYDASAHKKGYKSLNEVLHRGPVMLPDLVGVLLRFRMMKLVIIADIEKAFLQIGLHPEEIVQDFYGSRT